MLSSSGDDFAIPHDSNPLSDDVLAIVGGHLDVHSSPISLKLGGHVGVPVAIPKVADFTFVGVYCPVELVDAAAGFGEALVGEGGVASHR